MRQMRPLLAALGLAALAGCVRVYAPPSARPGPGEPAAPVGQAADTGQAESPFKKWSEVVKDAEVIRGLFTLYRKGDDLHWAIGADQLDKDYLVVVEYSRGIGDYFLLGGLPLRRDVVRFERRGDHVALVLPPVYTIADPGTPMERAVELTYGASVLARMKIESVHEETGAILVNMKEALVTDWAGIGPSMKAVLGMRGSLDSGRSSLATVKAFPENVEIGVDLTFRYEGDRPLPTVPDRRFVPIGVHYSWLELPDPPMRPRLADDRIGHFVAARMNFSRDTASTFFERYIERWRLERKDPSAALSEPVRPIVFYIDRTVPDRWRPYVKAGIENWNAAFERAGFEGAIVARDAPDDPDWDAEDARYSSIRWITPFRSTFAIGPSDVDPRTGEILNADILVTASFVQAWRSDWERIAAPTAAIKRYEETAALYERLTPAQMSRSCSYAQGFERQAAFVRSVLLARGTIAPGEPVPEEFIGAALVDLVMHEVGHALGLRHNFRASSATSYDRLHDQRFTASNGISGSVMDYNPVNVAVDRRGQGQYFMEGVGPYDAWAIEYAYTALAHTSTPQAERPGLEAILRRGVGDPAFAFGTDEDALFGPAGIDPLTQRFDLGSDPIGFARDRAALAAQVLAELETRILADGESYYRLRGAFNGVLVEKWGALLAASRVVGGQYVRRLHRGDANGATPFEPVPAARQRDALRFVIDEAFSAGAFEFSPALLNRLIPSRWLHWGANPFLVPVDYPVHEVVLGIQSSLLLNMLHPITLTRILDAEVKMTGGASPLTLAELFDELSGAIWSEVWRGSPFDGLGGYRRGIQRRYVRSLEDILLEPLPGTPEDARALARYQLEELGVRIGAVLDDEGRSLDTYSRAHLADTLARIERALAVSVSIDVRRR